MDKVKLFAFIQKGFQKYRKEISFAIHSHTITYDKVWSEAVKWAMENDKNLKKLSSDSLEKKSMARKQEE